MFFLLFSFLSLHISRIQCFPPYCLYSLFYFVKVLSMERRLFYDAVELKSALWVLVEKDGDKKGERLSLQHSHNSHVCLYASHTHNIQHSITHSPSIFFWKRKSLVRMTRLIFSLSETGWICRGVSLAQSVVFRMWGNLYRFYFRQLKSSFPTILEVHLGETCR